MSAADDSTLLRSPSSPLPLRFSTPLSSSSSSSSSSTSSWSVHPFQPVIYDNCSYYLLRDTNLLVSATDIQEAAVDLDLFHQHAHRTRIAQEGQLTSSSSLSVDSSSSPPAQSIEFTASSPSYSLLSLLPTNSSAPVSFSPSTTAGAASSSLISSSSLSEESASEESDYDSAEDDDDEEEDAALAAAIDAQAAQAKRRNADRLDEEDEKDEREEEEDDESEEEEVSAPSSPSRHPLVGELSDEDVEEKEDASVRDSRLMGECPNYAALAELGWRIKHPDYLDPTLSHRHRRHFLRAPTSVLPLPSNAFTSLARAQTHLLPTPAPYTPISFFSSSPLPRPPVPAPVPRCSSHFQSRYIPSVPVSTRKYESRLFCGHFSADGQIFINAGQDGIIRLYDEEEMRTGRRRSEFVENIASNSQPKKDPESFKEIVARGVGWSIVDLHCSSDHQFVIYTSWSEYLHLCNVSGDYELHESMLFSTTANSTTPTAAPVGTVCMFAARFDPTNSYILAGMTRGSIIQYDVEKKQRMLLLQGHQADVNAVTWIEPQLFASAADDATIKIWDTRASSSSSSLSSAVGGFIGHEQGLTYIASLTGHPYLLTNSKDQSMKLWDIRRMNTVSEVDRAGGVKGPRMDYRWHKYVRKGQSSSSSSSSFSPPDRSLLTYVGHTVRQTLIRCNFSPLIPTGNRYVYSGSSTGEVYVYDVLTGAVAAVLTGHDSIVRDVSWHPEENVIVTSSWDCTSKRYELSNRRPEQQTVPDPPATSSATSASTAASVDSKQTETNGSTSLKASNNQKPTVWPTLAFRESMRQVRRTMRKWAYEFGSTTVGGNAKMIDIFPTVDEHRHLSVSPKSTTIAASQGSTLSISGRRRPRSSSPEDDEFNSNESVKVSRIS